MLRNATGMHAAPSKYNFDKKTFVVTKMSAFSQTSATFLGVRAQKIYLDIKMDRLLTTAGTVKKKMRTIVPLIPNSSFNHLIIC